MDQSGMAMLERMGPERLARSTEKQLRNRIYLVLRRRRKRKRRRERVRKAEIRTLRAIRGINWRDRTSNE
jgi:hypothetical protein